MKRFIVAVVLLSIVFTLLSDEATGFTVRKKPDVDVKPKCPPPGIGICVRECGPGKACSDGKICCFNGCGHTCVDPVDVKPKCPPPGIGICVRECGPGKACSDGKICCFNGCGHTCVDPVY